jgi:hypothetical protein
MNFKQRGSDFPTHIYSQACTASSGYAAVRMAYLTLMERQSSEANKLSKNNTQTHFTNAHSCKPVVKYYPASTMISVKHYPASAAISVDRGGTQQYWQPRLRNSHACSHAFRLCVLSAISFCVTIMLHPLCSAACTNPQARWLTEVVPAAKLQMHPAEDRGHMLLHTSATVLLAGHLSHTAARSKRSKPSASQCIMSYPADSCCRAHAFLPSAWAVAPISELPRSQLIPPGV